MPSSTRLTSVRRSPACPRCLEPRRRYPQYLAGRQCRDWPRRRPSSRRRSRCRWPFRRRPPLCRQTIRRPLLSQRRRPAQACRGDTSRRLPRKPIRPPAAPDALPKGADRLTLPFFVDESDLPSAENAMLRDFATRYGAAAQYTVRAFATSPAGDDDPSTPAADRLSRVRSRWLPRSCSPASRPTACGSSPSAVPGALPPIGWKSSPRPLSSAHTNAVSSP